jgi:hypothetical protein
MASRPIIYKCPNYQDCLTGYRGEDIEVFPEMAAVCPECGGALRTVPKTTPAYVAHLTNLAIIAAIAGAFWFAWPGIVSLFKKAPAPAPVPAQRK